MIHELPKSNAQLFTPDGLKITTSRPKRVNSVGNIVLESEYMGFYCTEIPDLPTSFPVARSPCTWWKSLGRNLCRRTYSTANNRNTTPLHFESNGPDLAKGKIK